MPVRLLRRSHQRPQLHRPAAMATIAWSTGMFSPEHPGRLRDLGYFAAALPDRDVDRMKEQIIHCVSKKFPPLTPCNFVKS